MVEARQEAAAVRVEELEAELERVRAALAEAEEVLRHRVIGLEQCREVLAGEDAPTVAAVSQKKPVGPRRAVRRGRNRGVVGGLPGVDGRCSGSGRRGVGCPAGGGGAGLGQRVRFPCRGSEGTAETPGLTAAGTYIEMTSRLTEPLLWGLAGTGLRRAGAGQGSQRLTRLRAAGRQAHVRCRAELRLITCAVAGAVGAGALLIGGALVFFVRRRKA